MKHHMLDWQLSYPVKMILIKMRKVNTRLKFLYCKTNIWDLHQRRLSNAVTQLYFEFDVLNCTKTWQKNSKINFESWKKHLYLLLPSIRSLLSLMSLWDLHIKLWIGRQLINNQTWPWMTCDHKHMPPHDIFSLVVQLLHAIFSITDL